MADGGLGSVAGKIPPAGWAIAIGGGLLIAFYMRGRGSGSSSAPQQDLSNGVGTGAVGGQFIPVTPPTVPAGPKDIEGWGIKALGYLIGAGYSPLEASQAVRKFIDGQALTSKEKTMIDAALVGVPLPDAVAIPVGGGIIPNPAPAPVVTPPAPPPPSPPPAPTPTPAPAPSGLPAGIKAMYTVKKNDNLTNIAWFWYGIPTWQKIYNANRDQISNPNLIYPGQVLRIPW